MFKGLIFTLLFFFSYQAFTQEKTRGDELKPTIRKGKVLLVPFDERMYNSEFDRELAEKQELTFPQIRGYFRKAIDTSLYMNVLVEHSVVSLLRKNDKEEELDFFKLLSSVELSYEEVQPVIANKKQVLKGKPGARQTSGSGNNSNTGELANTSDTGEKYMAVRSKNPSAFMEMNEKYGSEYFIFINQVEIKREKGTSYQAMEQNNYQKEVKLHYTILNLKGDRIASGVASSGFPSEFDKIQDYVSKGISPATSIIANALPKTEE